jgi:hypothetical protein
MLSSFPIKISHCWEVVAQACNPSKLGGRDLEYYGVKQTQELVQKTLSPKYHLP